MTGNELERKVKNILRKYIWGITPSAYYTDTITQKPREKDIIATNVQQSYDEAISYNARLFIECKVFPKTTEIYEHTNPSEIENTILHFNIPFANFSEIERSKNTHIYKYNKIFEPKDSDDFLYPAINQNLQSFNAFRKANNEKGIYFLMVVFDGELVCANQSGEIKKCDNALVKIETLDNTFNLPNKECFIELVSLHKFENLFAEIRDDIKKIDDSIIFYRKKVERIKKYNDAI